MAGEIEKPEDEEPEDGEPEECKTCGGDGFVLLGSSCTVQPWQECCGGCERACPDCAPEPDYD